MKINKQKPRQLKTKRLCQEGAQRPGGEQAHTEPLTRVTVSHRSCVPVALICSKPPGLGGLCLAPIGGVPCQAFSLI